MAHLTLGQMMDYSKGVLADEEEKRCSEHFRNCKGCRNIVDALRECYAEIEGVSRSPGRRILRDKEYTMD